MCREFKRLMKETEGGIVIIHHNHYWSFKVINQETGTLTSYDFGSGQGHKLEEANAALLRRVRSIMEGEKSRWNAQRATVPRRTDGCSCGYRMLSYIQDFCEEKETKGKNR